MALEFDLTTFEVKIACSGNLAQRDVKRTRDRMVDGSDTYFEYVLLSSTAALPQRPEMRYQCGARKSLTRGRNSLKIIWPHFLAAASVSVAWLPQSMVIYHQPLPYTISRVRTGDLLRVEQTFHH